MSHKAVALLSGGLDSTLAVRLILDQGVKVRALNFVTPFCTCSRKGQCEAKHVADEFGIPIRTVALVDEFFAVLRNPQYGYGSGMNPCLDCRILMFSRARQSLDETGADFVFTGEVLGQRPISQHLRAMRIIDRESGLDGLCPSYLQEDHTHGSIEVSSLAQHARVRSLEFRRGGRHVHPTPDHQTL